MPTPTPRVLVVQDINFNFVHITVMSPHANVGKPSILPLLVVSDAFAIYSISDKFWVKNRHSGSVVDSLASLLGQTWRFLPEGRLVRIGDSPSQVAITCDDSNFYCGYRMESKSC